MASPTGLLRTSLCFALRAALRAFKIILSSVVLTSLRIPALTIHGQGVRRDWFTEPMAYFRLTPANLSNPAGSKPVADAIQTKTPATCRGLFVCAGVRKGMRPYSCISWKLDCACFYDRRWTGFGMRRRCNCMHWIDLLRLSGEVIETEKRRELPQGEIRPVLPA